MKREPLYQKVYNDIIDKIKSGEICPGDKLPTELQLAQIYGVSRITVQRALAEIEASNIIYRVKKAGTFVNGKRHSENQFIAPLIMPYDESVNGLQNSLERYALLSNGFLPFHNSHDNVQTERALLENAIRNRVNGLLVYPCLSILNIDMYAELKINRIPFVFIDREIDGIATSLVTTQNREGMFQLVSRLIERGHRKIGFFAINNYLISTEKERFLGYCDALISHGIAPNNAYIYNFNSAIDKIQTTTSLLKRSHSFDKSCKSLVQEFIDTPNRPTALCCMNDTLAVSVLNELKRRSVRVPEDVSLTGFDDLAISSRCTPALTTVAQDFNSIAKYAVRALLELMQDREKTKTYRCATKIIERESLRSIEQAASV